MRPDPYKPPDRDAWLARHGVAPYPASHLITQAALRDSIASLAAAARAYASRDWTTLDAETANRFHARLDLLNDEIAALLKTDNLIYYDPTDNQFWVYPES